MKSIRAIRSGLYFYIEGVLGLRRIQREFGYLLRRCSPNFMASVLAVRLRNNE
jgi:hypothetical protein